MSQCPPNPCCANCPWIFYLPIRRSWKLRKLWRLQLNWRLHCKSLWPARRLLARPKDLSGYSNMLSASPQRYFIIPVRIYMEYIYIIYLAKPWSCVFNHPNAPCDSGRLQSLQEKRPNKTGGVVQES